MHILEFPLTLAASKIFASLRSQMLGSFLGRSGLQRQINRRFNVKPVLERFLEKVENDLVFVYLVLFQKQHTYKISPTTK